MGEQEARLVVGDSEEGVSVYTYEEGNLKLHGFDIALRQTLYADAVGQRFACLDYQGDFTILDHLKDNTNPLLKHNLEAIFTYKFNELIRKFTILE